MYNKELHQQKGNGIKTIIEGATKEKVEVAFINLGYETKDNGFEFFIYKNEYDYIKVNIGYVEDVSDNDYAIEVLQRALDENRHESHKASAEEIFIINLLKEFKSKNIYINDGILMEVGSSIEIYLDDIDSIKFNRLSNTIDIEIFESADEVYKYCVDLNEDNIEE